MYLYVYSLGLVRVGHLTLLPPSRTKYQYMAQTTSEVILIGPAQAYQSFTLKLFLSVLYIFMYL